MDGQSGVTFVRYRSVSGKTYAIFSDPFGGVDFPLDKEGCRERLENLKKNNFSTRETITALEQWPTAE